MTGDAVNVAARLEQAAPTNEVLIGELTYRLTRDAVDVEAVEALELKGKADRVAAYRLLAARGMEGYQRRIDTALVGRELEMAQLDAAFGAVIGASQARSMTVMAEAGIGKSRLVAEFARALGDSGVTVLRGRCLAYGKGITFWPLRGAVREAAAISDDDSLPRRAHGWMHSSRIRTSPSASPLRSDWQGKIAVGEIALGRPPLLRASRRVRPGVHRVRRHPLGGGHVPRPSRRAHDDPRPRTRLHRGHGAARPA